MAFGDGTWVIGDGQVLIIAGLMLMWDMLGELMVENVGSRFVGSFCRSGSMT